MYHPDLMLDTDISDLTQPAKTVMHLIEPLLNLGYTLGLDNLYSDPRLFKLLLDHVLMLLEHSDPIGNTCLRVLRVKS